MRRIFYPGHTDKPNIKPNLNYLGPKSTYRIIYLISSKNLPKHLSFYRFIQHLIGSKLKINANLNCIDKISYIKYVATFEISLRCSQA